MVEELIADGMTPDDVVSLLSTQFGMSEGDAFLLVSTALGGPGDQLDRVEDAAWWDEDEDDLEDVVAAGFDETQHPREQAGRREGGRFAPKDGTSSKAAQAEANAAADAAQAGEEAGGMGDEVREMNEAEMARKAEVAANLADEPFVISDDLEQEFIGVAGDPYKLGRMSDAELKAYRDWAEEIGVADAGNVMGNEYEEYLGYRDAARVALEQRDADRAYVAETTAVASAAAPGEVVNVARMGIASTNPVYKGELDGRPVVVKPESQLSPTQLRTWVEPGYDLEREQAAAHVASLIAQDSPDVAVMVPAHEIKDVQGYGRSGVSDYIDGETMAESYRLADRLRGKYDGPPLGGLPAQLPNIQLYDGIIGNTDRHEGNIMIDRAGGVHAIDHGLAFPSENQEGYANVQGGNAIVPLEPAQRAALEHLQQRIVGDAVLPTLLTTAQIRGMQERIGVMLKNDRLPTRNDWDEGWVWE